MSDFFQILRDWRKSKGLTQADMGSLLGIGKNYVYQLETGDREPSDTIRILFDLMVRNDTRKQAASVQTLKESESAPGALQETPRQYSAGSVRWVPVIPWQTLIDLEDIEALMQRTDVLKVPVVTADPGAFVLELKGDAMADRFTEGTKLVISPATALRNECLCVAKPPGSPPMFRRYVVNGSEGFHLVAYNPIYPATRHCLEDFEWIYPVVGVYLDTWGS